ncbi:MAG: histidine kinase [Mucilaginibacter sp.]|nr:histidine kinase [Mucilaginibacter sp.]
MKINISKQQFKFYIQVTLGYLLFWLVVDSANARGSFWSAFFNNVWLVIYLAVINFIFFEYTLPFLRRKRPAILKTLWWLLVVTGLLSLFSFGLYAWRFLGIQLHIYTALIEFKSVEKGTSYIVPHGLLSVFFFGLFKYRYNHLQLKLSAQQLRLEKREAELNYLRSQTNPHFLFNTLNNIYSLARDKSELAPESILRLSGMLRFMLYETGGDFIAIEHEVRIISEYLELEKLRYDDSLRINFNYDIEDMKQAVPPLLLVPLVENAFKHGVSETRDNPSADIHLSVNQRQLVFLVKNSTEESTGEPVVRENIGLSNLRRQLELQYTDYSLNVRQGPAQFTATLKINLASHV